MHSCVNIFPESLIILYALPCSLPEIHPFFSCWINQAPEIKATKAEFQTLNLGEFIKGNATLFFQWHLWSHSMSFFRHLWLYVIIINILLTVLLHSSSEVVIEVSWIVEHPYPRTVLSQVKLALSALKPNSVFILTMKHPLTANSSSNNVYFCRDFVGESWRVYVKPYRRKHLFGPGHYLRPLQCAQDTFSLDSVLTMALLLKISTPDLLPLSCSHIPGKVSAMLLSPCVYLQTSQCHLDQMCWWRIRPSLCHPAMRTLSHIQVLLAWIGISPIHNLPRISNSYEERHFNSFLLLHDTLPQTWQLIFIISQFL